MENVKGFKNSEKTVRILETENTIVMIFDRKSRKLQIKKMIEEELKVKIESVNTLLRDNKKIAYIKLKKEYPAADIATKFGLI